jgi:hypothetical protein
MSLIIGKTTPSYWLLLASYAIRRDDALWASHTYDLPIQFIWTLLQEYPYHLTYCSPVSAFYFTSRFVNSYLFFATWFIYYHAFCSQDHGRN